MAGLLGQTDSLADRTMAIWGEALAGRLIGHTREYIGKWHVMWVVGVEQDLGGMLGLLRILWEQSQRQIRS